MLPFSIHITDGQPAAEQVIQAVRQAILTGVLRDGDRFPSVRTLSQELRISPTTAHKAVIQLKSEGLLAAQPGIGMAVRTNALPDSKERLEMLKPTVDQMIQQTQALQLSAEELNRFILERWK